MGGGGWNGAKGGDLRIDTNGQEVLNRSNCIVHSNMIIELRLSFNLPAKGRRIMGDYASSSLKNALDTISSRLNYKNWNNDLKEKLKNHLTVIEDQYFLRNQLKQFKWISFIANGSILPRESGVSEKPLSSAINFKSPKTLEQTVTLQSGKQIQGMAIKQGVTIIVGGGFHGKSTLVNAICKSIYDHIPGDGRE